LIVYYVKLFLLGSTPRSVYGIKNTMRSVQWGTLFPATTLIMVITLVYSVIQPIIVGLSCGIFFLLYQLWKYLFTYQFNQPAASDTGGLFFPKAMSHIFVGLYVEQICLAALFFLFQDQNGKPKAIPEGALMIVLLVITIGFHMILLDSYGPLLRSLPLSLVDRAAHAGHEIPGESANTSTEGVRGQDKVYDSNSRDIEANSQNIKPSAEDVNAPADGLKRNDGPKDFEHPSMGPVRVVWIPKDDLGLGESEEAAILKRGLEASTQGAFMNEKGQVDVDSVPPGRERRPE